jgi:hypothetical protein
VTPPIHRQDVIAAMVKVGGSGSTDSRRCPHNDDTAWISHHAAFAGTEGLAPNLKGLVTYDLPRKRSRVLVHEGFFIETFPKGLS